MAGVFENMGNRVAIYTRVSTEDQTCENQKMALLEVAAQRGWRIVKEFTDHGISGAKDRSARPGLAALLHGVTRGRFDIVMCWSVDRLGRSLVQLLTTMGEMDAAGVNLYLHQQAVDTTTPAGRALFQMLGVFAEFERSLIKERIMAGLARSKAQGKKPGPKRIEIADPERYARVKELLTGGATPWTVHRMTGTGHSTVLRIRAEIQAGDR
jgi:DNA invertase Pin-like site-specific DNA recombinase